MENMISVIVLTYNQEKTIARTLDSILMQKCRLPYEIVIGDDCSTDTTRTICEEYQQRYPSIIRLMKKAPNKGVIDNYFDTLLECKGTYIADCAGDDFWTDGQKLEKEVCILESNPDVTLVHTNWMYFNEKTQERTPCPDNPFGKPITNGKDMLEAIIVQTTSPIIHLCTALYRKETLLKAYRENTFLFRNKDFGCEDLQICFTLARMGKIAFMPDYTLNYSCGEETVSYSNDSAKQFRFVKRVTDLSHYLSKEYNIHSNNINRYFSQRLFALSMHAFRGKDKALRTETIACARKWNARITPMTKAVLTVTSNKATWSVALWLRKLFVRIKAI
ncbi:MAG: glycosyltransferase [Prevotellaceae bacterium]|nr:glycosyltransferase [Prevotellaceae bacterium]